MTRFRFSVIALTAIALTACRDEAPTVAPIRPVRTVTVERGAIGETLSLTGQIKAQVQENMAFRLDGRMIERRANVGDQIKAGQVVARLDPQIQQNGLRQAQANLSAARGQLLQARNEFDRQRQLLETGNTPRARFDQAQQARQTAEAQVESAAALLRNAEEQLSYTELKASVAGTVTTIGAEPGEVVPAGRMVIQLAQAGGRDAVFDVPAQVFRAASPDVTVVVALSDDPDVKVDGRVREVAPQADPVTRTYAVKVGLIDPPEAMRLGATVTGRVVLKAPSGLELPASALTQSDKRPAVWVVDPQSKIVSLRDVEVVRYDSASVIVGKGLEPGETVVTAGVQVLRPGQKVRLLGAAK